MKTVRANLDISDIKRCYLDFEIKFKCPECKSIIIHDFSDRYLPFPTIDRKDFGGGFCDKCDEFVLYPLTVKAAYIVIEYDPDKVYLDK